MSLVHCINKLSGGKNKSIIPPEIRKDLWERVAEYTKTMPKAAAEERALREVHADIKADKAYVTREIRRQVPLNEPKKSPAEPENIQPETPPRDQPQVHRRVPQPKSIMDHIREFTGNTLSMDSFSNAFLGRMHSALSKTYEAGEQRGEFYSTLNPGRVTLEGMNRQNNGAVALVTNAMNTGHLDISTRGEVHAVVDESNNVHTLATTYANIQKQLAAMGFRERELDANDPHTVANMSVLALLGPRLEALVKDGVFKASEYTKADKAASDKLRADPTLKPLIEQYHRIYNTMREHAIKNLVDAGVFTEDKAREYIDRAEYLPLYRMDEAVQNNLGEAAYMSSILTAAREHHLGEGSERMIGDPLENSYKNIAWLQMRAIKGLTANIAGESLVAAKSAEWVKSAGSGKDPHIITITRNGGSAFLKIHDINDASAFAAAPVMTGAGWRLARAFTNVLRKGVTSMPGFVWGQVTQDSMRVAIMTNQGFIKSWMDVGTGFVKGMKTTDTPEMKFLRSFGVQAARDTEDGLVTFQKEMLNNPVSPWNKTKLFFEHMAMASDGAAREAAFKKTKAEALSRGMPEDMANFQAAHSAGMLIDFNNRGNSRTLAALMTVVPFVNARIQGTHRMVDALRGSLPGVDPAQARQMAMMQVGKLMAFTLAYTLAKQGDDEYERETATVRNNNFMFPGGLKMQVANELLPFKVLAEVTARQMMNDPNEDFSKSKSAVASALSSILMGPSDMVPSIARPILEQATDHSFSTGHDLVGKSLQRLSPEQQYTMQTTEAAKSISEGIGSVAHLVGLNGVSPIVLENYLTGWTGRVGQEALNLLRMAESGRATPNIQQTPFVGAMFVNPQGNALRADFQDVYEKVTQAHADLNDLIKRQQFAEAQEFRKENQSVLAMQGQVSAIEKQLSQITTQAKQGPMTDAKRDKLYARTQQILSRVPQLRKQAGF